MRELDMSQHGGAMTVYAGYGLGKKIRRAFRVMKRRHREGVNNVLRGVASDVGKAALSSALSGEVPTSALLKDAAAQSAKQRAKNEGKNMIRPYL